MLARWQNRKKFSFLNKNYRLGYLHENSRDQVRSYSTHAIVKPTQDSSKRIKFMVFGMPVGPLSLCGIVQSNWEDTPHTQISPSEW